MQVTSEPTTRGRERERDRERERETEIGKVVNLNFY